MMLSTHNVKDTTKLAEYLSSVVYLAQMSRYSCRSDGDACNETKFCGQIGFSCRLTKTLNGEVSLQCVDSNDCRQMT